MVENIPELEVGCGFQPNKRPGAVNSDLYPGPGVDVVFDAQKAPWPFEDNTFKRVTAFHVLEHLDDPMTFFREAWRVLIPNGIVRLQLPYGPSDNGLTDITHVRHWLPGTFAFLQPDYVGASGNRQHGQWQWPFEIQYIACRINPRLNWLAWRPWRRWGLELLWHLWGGHLEIIIGLRALKTDEAVKQFAATRPANLVPVAQVISKHELEGRELGEGEIRQLIQLNSGAIVTNKGERHVS